MTRILFVCLGNICRSPMAEFIFKDMVEKAGIGHEFVIASAATSTEEMGNPVHRGTKAVLAQKGICCEGKRAVQLTKKDYDAYDYIFGMETANVRNILRIVGGDSQNKVRRLLDLTTDPRDIADPWYTGNFEATRRDVEEGCQALLQFLGYSVDTKILSVL